MSWAQLLVAPLLCRASGEIFARTTELRVINDRFRSSYVTISHVAAIIEDRSIQENFAVDGTAAAAAATSAFHSFRSPCPESSGPLFLSPPRHRRRPGSCTPPCRPCLPRGVCSRGGRGGTHSRRPSPQHSARRSCAPAAGNAECPRRLNAASGSNIAECLQRLDVASGSNSRDGSWSPRPSSVAHVGSAASMFPAAAAAADTASVAPSSVSTGANMLTASAATTTFVKKPST